MELMVKREDDLTKIFKYSGWGFLGLYAFGFGWRYFIRGPGPFFRDVVRNGILCFGGTYGTAMMAEKIAAQTYYNTVLVQLSDKYNFTPEEVMDLQRNLNQYYIKKERELDIERDQ